MTEITLFQSTQPEWAATVATFRYSFKRRLFQSTQPEWAATAALPFRPQVQTISIHAARVGCDKRGDGASATGSDFNPRSPSGLRLYTGYNGFTMTIFQSTQPEWAATPFTLRLCSHFLYFNPRSPSGLRHTAKENPANAMQFQSTQPEWAATSNEKITRNE